MEDAAELIDALSGFAWPVLILALVWIFRSAIADFISRSDEASFKGLGVEAKLQRTAEVALSLGHAEGARGEDATARSPADVKQAATAVADAVNRATAGSPVQPSVLWVDDRPSNNNFERRALNELGIHVENALSTEAALTALSTTSFDLVITDMSRPEGRAAGYDLLSAMRQANHLLPLIIYSGDGSKEEHRAEAKRRGAYGSTNSPSELVNLVVDALFGEHAASTRKRAGWLVRLKP